MQDSNNEDLELQRLTSKDKLDLPSDFWECSLPLEAEFKDFVRYAFNKAKDLSRETILKALQQNDPNGVWSDLDSIREFGRPMTKAEIIQHYAVALAEDFPHWWTMLTWDELLDL